MSIFYKDEHIACSEYTKDISMGFKYVEVEQGTVFNVADKKAKHLFFFLEGSARVSYNEFPEKVFGPGEMIFIPKSADCRGEALTKCSYITHVYDAPVRLCHKLRLSSIVNSAHNVEYKFNSLPICQILMDYLQLFKVYLTEGMNCCNLHEIKQKELFMVLRTHYSKEDLAQLFFPMLGKSLDFRGKVMAHYGESKTVRELARFCSYSEGHFNDLFIAEFGEPPYKWMQKQKSKHVMGRLAQADVSIKEIVDEFEFSSQSHFNRFCRTQFGESASKIRQKLLFDNQ